jgi:ABC-type Na+ efflux pump permease subunit
MRIIVSFILTVIVYGMIAVFFLFFLFPKPKPEKKVYIHTAIIAKIAKINSYAKKESKTIKKKTVSKIKKTPKKVKKQGSKTDMTHGGGDIGFNDIFKNVDYNVNTGKVVQKKQLDMSRFRGIERNLKKIKKISVEVNFVQNGGKKLSKDEINSIITQKLYSIWYDISTIPSEYAKINIQSENGNVEVNILDSNLPVSKQTALINEIKKTNFDKNFNITVLFQSKVDND